MRFKNTAGMCLTLASCLLKPSILPAASLSTADVIVPDTIVVWPGAKIFLKASEDHDTVEAAVDGGMMYEVPGFILAPMTSGDYWLSVASRDPAGNASNVVWSFLQVDGDAPRLELKLEPESVSDDAGRAWLAPNSRALAAADDLVSGVARVSVGVEERVETIHGSSEASLALPAEGSRDALTVWADAADVVGNETIRVTREVFVDATPPDGEIVVEGPHVETASGLVLAPTARLRAVVDDDESGILEWSPSVDGATVAPSVWDGPWVEGSRQAEMKVLDRVGNETQVPTLRFRVDATAPDVTWRVRGTRSFTKDGTAFHSSPVWVEVEAVDSVAGVSRIEASADGSSFSPVDGDVVSDGDTLALRVTDNVGNVVEEQAAWKIDNAPPTLRIETSDGTSHAPGDTVRIEQGDELRILASDAGSGVSRVLREGSRAPVQPTESFRFLSAGRRIFRAVAEDNLGHIGRGEWHLIIERKGR